MLSICSRKDLVELKTALEKTKKEMEEDDDNWKRVMNRLAAERDKHINALTQEVRDTFPVGATKQAPPPSVPSLG